MSLTVKDNFNVQMDARKKLKGTSDPLEKLRYQCLARGATGIRGFSRQFRIMDDNSDKRLSMDEFKKGCDDFGVDLTVEEIGNLFQTVDRDGGGDLSFNEFLLALRPPMNELRTNLIKKAFTKLDRTGDGSITAEDLRGVYNAKLHQKYLNGEWSDKQVYEEFLKNFENVNSIDGKVTFDEFLDYYAAISMSIDDDTYFDLMMRNAFKL